VAIRTLAMPMGDIVSAIVILRGVSATTSGFSLIMCSECSITTPRSLDVGMSVRVKAFSRALKMCCTI
jgi:hypothetical protein